MNVPSVCMSVLLVAGDSGLSTEDNYLLSSDTELQWPWGWCAGAGCPSFCFATCSSSGSSLLLTTWLLQLWASQTL